jgi:hypothetical protein
MVNEREETSVASLRARVAMKTTQLLHLHDHIRIDVVLVLW